MSHLSNDFLDAATKREELRQGLVKILDSIRGRKVLVLDPTLSGPLSLITEFSFLKERGVERVYFLGPDPGNTTEAESLLYLCRPTLTAMGHVADHLSSFQEKDCHLYLVPRRTLLAERLLENRGVLGGLTALGTFPMGAIPIEDDIYSLELTSAFNDLYLTGDVSCLHTVATTIMEIQEVHGYFPRVLGKGESAKVLDAMLHRMRLEKGVGVESSAYLEELVVVDRACDLITPLLTQLTYEGLIDEKFGIRHGLVELPGEVGSTTRRQKLCLNSADSLYGSLRDLNFAEVGRRLHSEARRLDAGYQQRHAAQTVAEIRDFVSKLGGLQAEHTSLKTHTTLAEVILGFTSSDDFSSRLEAEQNLVGGATPHVAPLQLAIDWMDQQRPLLEILRLLCLQCLVHGGIPEKIYAQYYRDITQSYGYHHIVTLNNLEKVRLLYRQNESGQRYNAIAKAFRLVVDEVDERTPNDISYVYSGYAPLSVRLVQCGIESHAKLAKANGPRLNPAALTATLGGFFSQPPPASSLPSSAALGPGWSKFEDVLRLVPGPTFDQIQDLPRLTFPTSKPKLVVVVFLGGCTFTEIAALRYLSQSETTNRKFIILTTHIISGNSLISQLIEQGNQTLK